MAQANLDLAEGAVIGLPRALLFYELYPFWRVLFEKLGLALTVSGPTSRDLIEAGIRQAADEACLPVKAFYGHVMALRGSVDAVFLPRLVSLRPGTYTCPKLLGLPDMVRHNVGGLPPAVIADIDETKPGHGLAATGLGLAARAGLAPAAAKAAVVAAIGALASFRDGLAAGSGFEEAAGWPTPPRPVAARQGAGGDDAGPRVRVGLVGHAYNLFDPGVNFGILGRLADLGCEVVTSEGLSEDEVQAESSALPKEIFWSSGRRILAGATRFRRDGKVEGVIHIVSFGCGPDSMVGEIAERETRRESDLPYMVLTLDEHTAEAGLLTRLEAFVDMLQWRRARARRLEGTA